MGPLESYLKKLEKNIRSGDYTEPTHRSALEELVRSIQPAKIEVINEPKHIECGAPDLVVRKTTKHGPLPIGYIETKDLGKSLDEVEKSEQLLRYLKNMPNLVLTDYLEFRRYVDGELREKASLGLFDAKSKKINREKNGKNEVEGLLINFLAHTPEAIGKPEVLAQRMAHMTNMIRDRVVEALEKDKASAILRDLRKAFADTLIPELDTPARTGEFADMYAQTIAYGLFAARCNHRKGAPFRRRDAALEIPKTNPFLRKLFGILTGPDMDEEPYAGFVDDLVGLLAHSDIAAILENFGKRTKREDPVVHFYETFLATYDPQLREKRGVYYTPEPVVSYIVRSVDSVLKTRFGLSDGLADTATVEYETEDEQGNKKKEKFPRVLILDPACGTGTFLYAIVDLIREQFMSRGDAGMWSGYVKEQLLPRLFGFELLMAPYAVAHFKMGMQLAGQDLTEAQRKNWAYDFSGEERLGIFLTNTLEEAEKNVETLFGPFRVISEEARAAAKIKKDVPIMIVLGNPPYHERSTNQGKWINELLRGGIEFEDGTNASSYYELNGSDISEQNPRLQNDYVKFIRWAHWRIVECTGYGILAFITNHNYIDNVTFCGMRQQLMKAFDDIYILDLHGNVNKKERSPDGTKDSNVFDIKDGVAISIFIKDKRGEYENVDSRVYYSEIWGTEDEKQIILDENFLETIEWEPLIPKAPYYLFKPFNSTLLPEYEKGAKINEIFYTSSPGVKTHRDHFLVSFDSTVLSERISEFKEFSKEDIGSKYKIYDTSEFNIEKIQTKLNKLEEWRKLISRYLYRPFDYRYIYHHTDMIDRPRIEVMDHIHKEDNLALIYMRQVALQGDISHFFVSSEIINDRAFYSNKGTINCTPLYLYKQFAEKKKQQMHHITSVPWPLGWHNRVPNLNPDFIRELEAKLGLKFTTDGKENLEKAFGAEDVFNYIYAVFHSPTYRERYEDFLKIDFPRVPFASNVELFRELCSKGEALVSLHLMKSPLLSDFITHYPVKGDNLVDKGHPRYLPPGEPEPGTGKPLEEGRVYISKDNAKTGKKGQYFEGVPPEVWEFHIGGYQVCEKWLKDRRGRELTYDDLNHYQKIVVAFKETIRLMGEIDELIDKYGGWPIE